MHSSGQDASMCTEHTYTSNVGFTLPIKTHSVSACVMTQRDDGAKCSIEYPFAAQQHIFDLLFSDTTRVLSVHEYKELMFSRRALIPKITDQFYDYVKTTQERLSAKDDTMGEESKHGDERWQAIFGDLLDYDDVRKHCFTMRDVCMMRVNNSVEEHVGDAYFDLFQYIKENPNVPYVLLNDVQVPVNKKATKATDKQDNVYIVPIPVYFVSETCISNAKLQKDFMEQEFKKTASDHHQYLTMMLAKVFNSVPVEQIPRLCARSHYEKLRLAYDDDAMVQVALEALQFCQMMLHARTNKMDVPYVNNQLVQIAQLAAIRLLEIHEVATSVPNLSQHVHTLDPAIVDLLKDSERKKVLISKQYQPITDDEVMKILKLHVIFDQIPWQRKLNPVTRKYVPVPPMSTDHKEIQSQILLFCIYGARHPSTVMYNKYGQLIIDMINEYDGRREIIISYLLRSKAAAEKYIAQHIPVELMDHTNTYTLIERVRNRFDYVLAPDHAVHKLKVMLFDDIAFVEDIFKLKSFISQQAATKENEDQSLLKSHKFAQIGLMLMLMCCETNGGMDMLFYHKSLLPYIVIWLHEIYMQAYTNVSSEDAAKYVVHMIQTPLYYMKLATDEKVDGIVQSILEIIKTSDLRDANETRLWSKKMAALYSDPDRETKHRNVEFKSTSEEVKHIRGHAAASDESSKTTVKVEQRVVLRLGSLADKDFNESLCKVQ